MIIIDNKIINKFDHLLIKSYPIKNVRSKRLCRKKCCR